MKKNLLQYFLILMLIFSSCVSQQTPRVQATSQEVSDNLDLEAVASAFGEARNLEEFERILNDEKEHLSNLDLNNDGYTDYLRVVESVEGYTHVVTIQAALGNNIFQDVATIDVDKNAGNISHVQIIGNPYYYGNNYIIEPVYYHNPYLFDVFWAPNYMPWRSPFYWSYYPSYYRPWRPWPVHTYVNHVVVIRNTKNTYRYTRDRGSMTAANIQKQNRRDDFSNNKPDGSFNSRNKNYENKADLNKKSNYSSRGQRSENNNNSGTVRNNENNRNSSQRNANPRENRASNESSRPRADSRPSNKPSETSRGSRNSSNNKKNTSRGNN